MPDSDANDTRPPAPDRACVVAAVTPDRLAWADVLADSLRCHAAVPLVLCILGGEPGAPASTASDVITITEHDLTLPRRQRFVFQYSPFELCCAVKPWLIAHAHRLGFSRVVYLDCDMDVHDDLDRVFSSLQRDSVLLTPHVSECTSATGSGSLLGGLRARGLFNAGFVAVGDDHHGDEFLRFWMDRCRTDCIVDVAGGVHVDQGWLDFAPLLVDGVRVVREHGWNVGYWNVATQPLTRDGGGRIHAGTAPLSFFHFSGFDPRQPSRLSKHRHINHTAGGPVLAELPADYALRLEARGALRMSPRPHAFGRLSDGTSISPLWREAVRIGHPAVADVEDPFDVQGTPRLKQRLRAAAIDVLDTRKDWQQSAAVAFGKRVQQLPGLGWVYRRLRAWAEQYR